MSYLGNIRHEKLEEIKIYRASYVIFHKSEENKYVHTQFLKKINLNSKSLRMNIDANSLSHEF